MEAQRRTPAARSFGLPQSSRPAGRVRFCGDGRPGLVRRLRDRGRAARVAWRPGLAHGDGGRGARDHRAGLGDYHQLYARFPEGGGDAAAASAAFGEGWAFLPRLPITDYALTISISVAAGASAIIAYVPELAPGRIELALGLLCFVAGLTWFGHGGRLVFATMTIAFVVVALVVVAHGFISPVAHGSGKLEPTGDHHGALLSVLLAFPVAMALATGVEAPSSAIAQLGQLDDSGRRRFGRITLWLMLAIVATLTLGLSALAVSLRIGIPPADSTTIAEVARAATGEGALFAAFQVTTAVLLLAAASSSFQAGPGLLKALARGGVGVGVLPDWLGRTNRHHTPYWGVVVFLAVSAVISSEPPVASSGSSSSTPSPSSSPSSAACSRWRGCSAPRANGCCG